MDLATESAPAPVIATPPHHHALGNHHAHAHTHHRHSMSQDSTDSAASSVNGLHIPPTYSRLPPDGHEFPPDYRDPASGLTIQVRSPKLFFRSFFFPKKSVFSPCSRRGNVFSFVRHES